MKAIIVAAGMGRRLSPYTDDRPKCLVELRGRPLLARQLDAYRRVGVDRFVIVRGYRGDDLHRALVMEPDVSFIDNVDFARNNILLSLMYAAAEMPGGFLFSYGDIIFHPEVVAALVAAPGDLTLTIDPHWRGAYEGRTDHPVSEAELAAVDAEGLVRAVGKGVVPAAEAHGEFIGLLRASPEGAAWMLRTFERRRREAGALLRPYGRAPRLEVAYLSDLLNDLIAQGLPISSVDIARRDAWREIDTVQDLHRAAAVIDW